jgi:hypothetical protein
MKKKYLAYFIPDLISLNAKIISQKFLIEKLCKNFDKLFIINTQNLKFLKTDEVYNAKDFLLDKKNSKLIIKNKYLKLPNNVHFFSPSCIKDFENFMINKELVVINSIGRHFNELRVHFLIKKYNIRQIQISNLGNLQTEIHPVKKYDLMSLLYKYEHKFSRLITVILSNLGFISKIDIRFITDKKILKTKNNNNFLFNYFKLGFYKRHILINSKAYDNLISNNPKISENKIVLLDVMFDHPEFLEMGSTPKLKDLKKYYKSIKQFLELLKKKYKKKVVICIHPKDSLKNKKRIYNKYAIIKYATQKNIIESFMVLFTDSSAIIDAILLKKKIIIIDSSFIDKNSRRVANDYHKKTGIFRLDLNNYTFKSKKKFLQLVDKSKNKQLRYTKSFVAPDKDNLGYKKIINVLKKEFF